MGHQAGFRGESPPRNLHRSSFSLTPTSFLSPRPMSQLAMKATPYRKDFYTRLGGPEAEVELKGWLAGLEKIVSQMEGAYKSNGWGTV
jgi:hypothetical protein